VIPDGVLRVLGKTGRRVSPVGFGCYRVDDRVPAHRAALEAALDAGVDLIDTSTNYGDGHSELLVGKVLASRGEWARPDVTVVTKAGYVQGGNQREALERRRAGRPWPEMVELSRDLWHCISPEFLHDQLTASLTRLAMPRVDVFLLHNPEYFLKDAEHRGVPLAEARDQFYDRIRRALAALDEEVSAGRLGACGISSNTFVEPRDRSDAVDLTRVLKAAPASFSVVQLPMNPLELGALRKGHAEDGRSVLDVARDADLGVLVNRPLNAFSGNGLVRFATVRLAIEAPKGAGDPFEELAGLERDFARKWARRVKMGPGMPTIGELLALADLLREVKDGVADLTTFNEVWEQHVAPRLTQLLPQLEELFAKDRSFAAFASAYRSAALRGAKRRPRPRSRARCAARASSRSRCSRRSARPATARSRSAPYGDSPRRRGSPASSSACGAPSTCATSSRRSRPERRKFS
jgi:aryl-alcohol dehydrogenase-like predicted oxidoreductase